MSKIRIYELAKELGVDNKVVINKAIELGFPGKASHSNSLDADEADQIRRAVIRHAIGVSPASEVVTKRVDKVTGATNTVVERRSGNVIRRRKADSATEEAAEKKEEVAAAPAESEEPTLDSIFKEVPQQPEESTLEAEANGALVAAEAAEVEEEPVPVPEAKRAEDASGQAAPVQAGAPKVEEETKKTIGPRVLGKIELPTKRPPKPEIKRPAGTIGAAHVVVTEDGEEEDGKKKAAAKRRTKKREFSRVDLVDYEGREMKRGPRARGGAASRDDASVDRRQGQTELTKPKASKRVVKFNESITVGELARQMSLKAGEVIAKLIQLGVMATINQAIDQDTATIIAEEFDFQIESTGFDETEILEDVAEEDTANLKPRAPIVTVMGHVDHGKTSLLDAIRNTAVAEKEHGGITQHIGAYSVNVDKERKIAFIDTPGHAAFTSMRARGAKVTDIVVLVVAADDGVMPQTIEAINHAKAAEVPIIVAINKIDKHGGNPDKIKQQLVEHGLQPEDWGGDTMFFGVSALKGQGIKELLEGILLLAEVKELKANPERRARGTIIEAKQDRGRGTVATVLVQNGTLRVGDLFVTGAASGRIRSMVDHNGERVEEAGPSTPVEITGISEVPEAGDDFFVVESEQKARQVAANRLQKKAEREERALASGPISLEEFARRAKNMSALELGVILKADMHGSVEAARESIEKLSTDKVRVRVLHAAVGGVNESDVQLAIASKAIIVGFGVRGEPRALADAERVGVEVRFYRVIYELLDDVKNAMAGMLEPVKQEVPLGRAEVRDTFAVSKVGTIAGCYVVDGTIKRGSFVRLLRDSRVVYEGKMGSLKRFKDDVREVNSGYECGIGIENFNDVKSGDVMEVFEIQEVAATLD